MKSLFGLIAGAFGSAAALVIAVLCLFSVPLSVVALMRVFEWEWWSALIAVVVIGLVPLVGPIALIVATLIGAYFIVAADFSVKSAISPNVQTFRVEDLSDEQLEKYQLDVIAPDIRRACLSDAQQKYSIDGKIPERAEAFCECYAKVAASSLSREDIVAQRTDDASLNALRDRIFGRTKVECAT